MDCAHDSDKVEGEPLSTKSLVLETGASLTQVSDELTHCLRMRADF